MLRTPLITAKALSENLLGRVKILETTWHLPPANPAKAFTDWQKDRIPTSRFADIDKICDPNSPLPHMLPTPQHFAQSMEALGISNEDPVVLYHRGPIPSSFRVWWMMKVFGHRGAIAILQGGWNDWISNNFAVETAEENSNTGNVDAGVRYECGDVDIRKELVKGIDNIKENFETKKFQVIDARSLGRFTGQSPEPRPGLPSGHMPGALCIPFDAFFVAGSNNCTLKSAAECATVYLKAFADSNNSQLLQAWERGELDIVNSCGSGVTACISQFVLSELLGERHVRSTAVYDGSWTEYAQSGMEIVKE